MLENQKCVTFRPHWKQDIATKSFPRSDLICNLQGNLQGNQMCATSCSSERGPGMRGSQEILILNVHKSTGFPDCSYVCILYWKVHNLVLCCTKKTLSQDNMHYAQPVPILCWSILQQLCCIDIQVYISAPCDPKRSSCTWCQICVSQCEMSCSIDQHSQYVSGPPSKRVNNDVIVWCRLKTDFWTDESVCINCNRKVYKLLMREHAIKSLSNANTVPLDCLEQICV